MAVHAFNPSTLKRGMVGSELGFLLVRKFCNQMEVNIALRCADSGGNSFYNRLTPVSGISSSSGVLVKNSDHLILS